MSSAPRVVPPAVRGGWWHDYVCPAHGVALDPVGLSGGNFPADGAPCGHGCRVDTEQVRSAWAVLAHQECARRILALAGSDSATDRESATELLEGYAELYLATPAVHAGAASWMLRGRLFHQALTEAIWAVRIGTAARALDSVLPRVGELLRMLASGADQARDELVAQDRFASNYTAWLVAAGWLCSGDPERLPTLYDHVLVSTGDDGWEWEGSSYYHTFVLRAYLLALHDVPDADLPRPVLARLRDMVAVLDAVRTPDGTLPALHDGPYAGVGTDDEYAELWSLVAARGWPAEPPTDGITVFGEVGYVVLRGDGLHAIVDFGPHGGSHGHRDKLAVYLYGPGSPWQPDPGQVPYGHRRWREYYSSTRAHPTFVVDGDEQAECTGTLLHVTDTEVLVEVGTAYPGVRAQRRLTLGGGGLIDVLTVHADTPRRITLQMRPDVPLDLHTDGHTGTTVWHGTHRLVGRHTCDQPEATMLCTPGPGPADDPQRTRTHVDWTVPEATLVSFSSIYRTEQP